MKLLLIEPNESHAKLIRDRIKSEIHSVGIDGVTTLKKGLGMLERHTYDCILTDVATPDVSGTKLIAQLRKAAGPTPIIVVTGRSDDRMAADIIKSGASDYISKSRTSLETIPELVRKNIIKSQVKNPLSIPTHAIRKLLDDIEKNVSAEVRSKIRKIRKNAEKLLLHR